MDSKRVAFWASVAAAAGGVLAAALIVRARRIRAQVPEVVTFVDMRRYLGKWYEIARYPNWFQKDDCVATTATYTQRADGRIDVLNQCHRGGITGPLQAARGVARVADATTNARLKVTFFWPFAGDYWIIDLGPNYEYTVVSEPQRRYLWILSRRPAMEMQTFGDILRRLRGQGFDTSKLIYRTG